MTKLEAAARQAITVLSQCLEHPEADDAIAGLREALAEQAAEPVEWPHKWGCRANAFGECNMGCTVQQPSHQAAEPNAVLVEGFGRVAMRKLNDLHENGYAINGVSIATISEAGETNLGAVTTGGRVLWWPQQPLTDKQIGAAIKDWMGLADPEDEPSVIEIARAIEAAHGITSKEGGAA